MTNDCPPELVFVHGGHTGKLNDISWNYDENWFLASVAEDNIVQVWCPGAHVTGEEDLSDGRVGASTTAARSSAPPPPAASQSELRRPSADVEMAAPTGEKADPREGTNRETNFVSVAPPT